MDRSDQGSSKESCESPKFEDQSLENGVQYCGERNSFVKAYDVQPKSLSYHTDGKMYSDEQLKSANLKLMINPKDSKKQVTEKSRDQWTNKWQFLAGAISYAIGLGNIWRFPYLCQKNGGGAFLIPYITMMFLLGMPLGLIELGIGQRLRIGPVGVWNMIHPYLGGIGITAIIVSFLVALYYNALIAWCLYYMYRSFTSVLPWANCPTVNGTESLECAQSASPATYFFNRIALETSDSIERINGFNTHMSICLVIAWVIIFFCIMRGIKSSGKVMYVTASLPILIKTIFLIRAAMLKGAWSGLKYMFTPDLMRLFDPIVWLEAATQIFYSKGLTFGGLIVFGSYNPYHNNCKRDVMILSFVNIVISIYTALPVFSVLGYMGDKVYTKCIKNDMAQILELYPGRFANFTELESSIPIEEYILWTDRAFQNTQFSLLADSSSYCDHRAIISKAAEGTGLAFIVFTEAIRQFPFPPLWAVLFFIMLLMLGMGSMFGLLEGVITSLYDARLIKLKKPVLSGIICLVSCAFGLIFTTRAGQYWIQFLDYFAGSVAMMLVAIFEIFGVVHVFGLERFVKDLKDMTGESVSAYWVISWRYICPLITIGVCISSAIKMFSNIPSYTAYDASTASQSTIPFPAWTLIIAFIIVAITVIPFPLVWFVRKFHILRMETDIPMAQRFIGTTQSTVQMVRENSSNIPVHNSSFSGLRTAGDESLLPTATIP